ncbi:MAG: Substrate-binding region of ABC-type glycine betaine transport system, partial [uncultured Solirubrobacteraceae bacterium]
DHHRKVATARRHGAGAGARAVRRGLRRGEGAGHHRRLDRGDRDRRLRQGRPQRAGVGRLDRQHLHRQGRARGRARVRGGDHQGRRDPGLPGDGRRQGRRRPRGLAAHGRVRALRREGQDGGDGRSARRRGPHRLVHPPVPDGREPRVRHLGGPQGQGGPLQDGRERQPGDVPGRRPRLRAEGQGAHQGARPQPQARDGGRRARAGGALEPALQAEEAGPLLLVHAPVPQPAVRPRRGGAAGALRGLQGRRQGGRRPGAVQVRLRRHGHQQALQQEVRRQRVAGLRRAEGDEADQRGSGARRQADRRRQGRRGEGRCGVGPRQRGQGRPVAGGRQGREL